MSASVPPIESEAQFDAALARLRALWLSPLGTPEGDEFEALMDAIEAYDRVHHPVPAPEPGAVAQ